VIFNRHLDDARLLSICVCVFTDAFLRRVTVSRAVAVELPRRSADSRGGIITHTHTHIHTEGIEGKTAMAAEIHSRPQSFRPVLLNKIEGHSDTVNSAVLIPKEDGVITVSEDRY